MYCIVLEVDNKGKWIPVNRDGGVDLISLQENRQVYMATFVFKTEHEAIHASEKIKSMYNWMNFTKIDIIEVEPTYKQFGWKLK